MKRLLSLALFVGLLIGALVLGRAFPAGNALTVDVDLVWILFPEVELWRVILISTGVGASLSTLVVGFAWLRGRLLNHRYRRAIRKLESELHEMRSLPLVGSDGQLRGESSSSAAAEVGLPEALVATGQV